jgi:hypothetical protein
VKGKRPVVERSVMKRPVMERLVTEEERPVVKKLGKWRLIPPPEWISWKLL